MRHSIDPIAFYLFDSPISWYWLFYPLGFLLVFALSYFYMKNLDQEKSSSGLIDFFILSWLGIILGGRIGYFLFYQWDLLWSQPKLILKFQYGGMSFHGAALGLAIALFLSKKVLKQSVFYYCDRVILFTPIALFLGRLGNFINGELWGRTTNLPWAMIFPAANDSLSRHPSQIYQAILEGPVLFFILWKFKNDKVKTHNSAVFLLLYSILRFISEFFREPDSHIGFIAQYFTYGQVLSLVLILGITYYLKHLYKTR